MLDKIFGTKEENPVKSDWTRKIWYLLLRVSWLLLPKFYLQKGDWDLVYISTQVLDFCNSPKVSKILSLTRSATREEHCILSLIYYISSFVLLVKKWTCIKKMCSYKILWPGLSENFPFSQYTSNDDWNFWKKRSLNLVISKNSNKDSWKLSEFKLWHKSNM